MNYEMWQGEDGTQKVVTETKFDNYFMYSIDKTGPMGEDGWGKAPCGPEAE